MMKYILQDPTWQEVIRTRAQVAPKVSLQFNIHAKNKDGQFNFKEVEATLEGEKIPQEYFDKYNFTVEEIRNAFYLGYSENPIVDQMLVNAEVRDGKKHKLLFVMDPGVAETVDVEGAKAAAVEEANKLKAESEEEVAKDKPEEVVVENQKNSEEKKEVAKSASKPAAKTVASRSKPKSSK